MSYTLVRLLAALGKLPPSAWDAIFPHGPIGRYAGHVASRAEQVELNPQPLPPKEVVFEAAAVARDVAYAAIAAEAAGADGVSRRIVSSAVDDWCGTGPHPFPWPKGWPFPWPPNGDPEPDWDVSAVQVVGALSLASVASRLADGETRKALSEGAERLLEAGLGGQRTAE